MDAQPFYTAISEARKRLHDVSERIALLQELQLERNRLEMFISIAEDILKAGEPGADLITQISNPREIFRNRSEDDPISDQKVWEMVHFVMKVKPKPMTADEILKELEREKFKIRGQHRRETVRGAILRKPDVFERVGRGMFGLKEWSDEVKRSRDQEPIFDEEAANLLEE